MTAGILNFKLQHQNNGIATHFNFYYTEKMFYSLIIDKQLDINTWCAVY